MTARPYRTMLIELLAAPDDYICCLVDYNAATETNSAYRQAHVGCARGHARVWADYMRHYSRTSSEYIGLAVALFPNWEIFDSRPWTARQHQCCACGSHLSTAPRMQPCEQLDMQHI